MESPHVFTDVFQEFQRPIYNYLLRMTQNPTEAEDLAQETFIRVHRSLPNFRSESSLSTWIYRIATNVSFDHFRRSSTRQAENTYSLNELETEGEWVSDGSASSPEHSASSGAFHRTTAPRWFCTICRG
jgi:RNA polymerase sigma factor (sigma-70 family)